MSIAFFGISSTDGRNDGARRRLSSATSGPRRAPLTWRSCRGAGTIRHHGQAGAGLKTAPLDVLLLAEIVEQVASRSTPLQRAAGRPDTGSSEWVNQCFMSRSAPDPRLVAD